MNQEPTAAMFDSLKEVAELWKIAYECARDAAVAFQAARDHYREALEDLKLHSSPVVDGWMSVPTCEWEQVFERIGRNTNIQP